MPKINKLLQGDKEHPQYKKQSQLFQDYLSSHIATCYMASIAIGLPHKNCTWFKAKLEQEKKLLVVRRDKCKISGRQADYITCNKTYLKNKDNTVSQPVNPER